jgi:hypothetical protein
VLSISTSDFKKDFAEMKLFTKSFKEEVIEKGELDQMKVLDIIMPEYEEGAPVIVIPSYQGKLGKVSHYARVRLDIPFATDPFVILPFKLWDGIAEPEALAFQDLAKSNEFASPYD